MKPTLCENSGIFIDYGCTGIKRLEGFVAMPLWCGIGEYQNDYIADLHNLILKYFDSDYKLTEKYITKD